MCRVAKREDIKPDVGSTNVQTEFPFSFTLGSSFRRFYCPVLPFTVYCFTDQVLLFFVGERLQTLYVEHLFVVCFLVGFQDGFRKFAVYQRLNEHSHLQTIDELLHTVRFRRTRCRIGYIVIVCACRGLLVFLIIRIKR